MLAVWVAHEVGLCPGQETSQNYVSRATGMFSPTLLSSNIQNNRKVLGFWGFRAQGLGFKVSFKVDVK
jgi:hypothetical protein